MDPVRDKNLESSDSPPASVSNGMGFLKRYIAWVFSFALALLLVGGYILLLAPPAQFPSGDIVVIARGAPVSDIATQLARARVIRHPLVLRFALQVSGAGSRVQAGGYLFSSPENVFTVARRLATGAFGLPPVRITFPEGVTVRDIAEKIAEEFPSLSTQDFISIGKSDEGYLFPDTYLFPPDATNESIKKAMRENFDVKIKPLVPDITAAGHSMSDIIILASLIEKEARTNESRQIVAGILWNRLARGMPLQVDAVFGYIFDRETYSPSFADLKVDSPYNTYLYKGLPPGPICNPGLESIRAALYPATTDYLYYLTGVDEKMHYATTYAEHQANQRKYLK